MKKALFIAFAAFLCAVLLLSLAACGKARGPEDVEGEGKVWYLGSKSKKKDFEDIENVLDPEEMYASITYSEPMLFGNYRLNDFDRSLKSFRKTASFEEISYAHPNLADSESVTFSLSTLPVKISAGPAALQHDSYGIRMVRTHDWAVLTFAMEGGGTAKVTCAFTVEGNKVRYAPVDYYRNIQDENYRIIGAEVNVGDTVLEYEFEFLGPYLTLKRDGQSVTLCAFSFSSDSSSSAPNIAGCVAAGSPRAEGLGFFLGAATVAGSHWEVDDYDFALDNFAIKICENGLMTWRWTEKSENGEEIVKSHQFIYFDCNYGMVLVDKDNTYFYYESSTSIKEASLAEGLSVEEEPAVAELTESEVDKAIEKKADLIGDLEKAFMGAGIPLRVDRTTGEIAIDASVLFGGDSSVLGDEGKSFLDRFIPIYTGVIYSDAYRGFVSRTVIEGHTAPLAGSTYESGLPLSEARAKAVLAYCLSIDTPHGSDLSATLEAVGRSNSKPVYGKDGQVDLDASRRVSFYFAVDLNAVRTAE